MHESERPAEQGRKPNYSIALRREAVRLVEAGRSQRAVSQELGIHVSTLLDWLKRYGTSYAQARPRFTATQRQQAARELLAGRLTLDEALLKYGVLYKKTLRQWVAAYQATLAAPPAAPAPPPAPTGADANATLHTQLREAQWQIEALQTLIDQAEATYKIAIRKKSGAKPSN